MFVTFDDDAKFGTATRPTTSTMRNGARIPTFCSTRRRLAARRARSAERSRSCATSRSVETVGAVSATEGLLDGLTDGRADDVVLGHVPAVQLGDLPAGEEHGAAVGD